MEGLVDEGAAGLREFYRQRRVLVTGSTGFKGAWLCRMLTMLGAQVTGYALEPPTNPSLFEIARISDEIDQVTADIRDFETLHKTFERVCPQAVFHLAAQPLVIESYARPRYTYETNVMGTLNVLECVRSCSATTSFLNVTTDKVYLNIERDDYAYREDDTLDGFDPYSNSKSCSELVTHAYTRSFFSPDAQDGARGRCAISTARAGNVVGGGDFAENRIVADCVRAAQSGEPLVIRNPNSVRPFQHVLEPLSAYLAIVALQDGDHTKASCYNIGPDEKSCISAGELAQLFASAWGSGFTYEARCVDGPHEASFLKLDCTKAQRELGWTPAWSAREAIEKTVQWTRAWLKEGAKGASICMDAQIREYLGE